MHCSCVTNGARVHTGVVAGSASYLMVANTMLAQRTVACAKAFTTSLCSQNSTAQPRTLSCVFSHHHPITLDTRCHSQSVTGDYELEPQVQQLVAKLHSNDWKAVCYVTGGAVQTISWLLSVAGASNTVLECSVPYARDSLLDILGQEPVQYCAQDTAVDMATAAYKRAAQLTGFGSRILGVAATCALATVPPKKGEHRAYLACHDGATGTHVVSLQLPKGVGTRLGEDRVVSLALLQLMVHACEQGRKQTPAINNANHTLHANSPATSEPQLISNSQSPMQGQESSSQPLPGVTTSHSFMPAEDPLVALLEGRVRCVEFSGGQVIVDAPRRNKVLLPGSFNPLHKGHIALLEAAQQVFEGGREAGFELTVGNPDKGMLSLPELRRRVDQFIEAGLPLIVTRASLFTLKADLLPHTCFVVGWDTAIRLVMPKYYGNSETSMLLEFARLRHAGGSFLVAGRKDPATGEFKQLHDIEMHPSLKDLFTELPEDQFRVDISSTELRKLLMTPPCTPPSPSTQPTSPGA